MCNHVSPKFCHLYLKFYHFNTTKEWNSACLIKVSDLLLSNSQTHMENNSQDGIFQTRVKSLHDSKVFWMI